MLEVGTCPGSKGRNEVKAVALPILVALAAGAVTRTISAGEAVRLASSPALSPDGRTLAFSWRGDVWVVSSTGGRARPLTSHPAHDDSPVFSPDGRSIAFTSDRSGSTQIWRGPVAGGELIRLTAHTEGLTLEDWFPDGNSILASATRDHFWRRAHRFFRIPADQRGAEELVFDAYGKNGALSPDGRRLLFTREGRSWWRKGYRGSASSQIWLRELGGEGFTELVREATGARWPLWRPDGRAFYHVSARSGSFNLWETEVGAVESRQLT